MKYTVSANVTISCYTEVEADSEQEALEIARERSIMELPANLGGEIEEEFVVEMLDGEVEDFVAVPKED